MKILTDAAWPWDSLMITQYGAFSNNFIACIKNRKTGKLFEKTFFGCGKKQAECKAKEWAELQKTEEI